MPERPALRVLNLLSRMGPPAKSAHTAFKTPNDTLPYNPWSAKGPLKSRKKLAAVHSTKVDWVTCKDWNYGGDDACEEGCYYEHICAKCFENYGARHAHPSSRCEDAVRGGKNDKEVVVQGVQEGRGSGRDSRTYPGSARRAPGQGQSPKQWRNTNSFKEPLVRVGIISVAPAYNANSSRSEGTLICHLYHLIPYHTILVKRRWSSALLLVCSGNFKSHGKVGTRSSSRGPGFLGIIKLCCFRLSLPN